MGVQNRLGTAASRVKIATEQREHMPGEGRRFRPGRSGNSKGRPKGSMNVVPTVRAPMHQVIADNQAAIVEAVRRALTSPRTVLSGLELMSKLNREQLSDLTTPATDAKGKVVEAVYGEGPVNVRVLGPP